MTATIPEAINAVALVQMLAARRTREGLSLRDVAAATTISASTLSRMESFSQHCHDINNLAKLARWLNAPISQSAGAIVVYEPNKLEAICRVIRKDPKLTPEAANVLCEIMTHAYQFVTGRQR